MLPDRTSYIEHLEVMCRDYRDSFAKGDDWARVPGEITEQFLILLRRSNVSASEAAELVRRCDEHQSSNAGIAFFAMCNTIRAWYRDIYEQELRKTL